MLVAEGPRPLPRPLPQTPPIPASACLYEKHLDLQSGRYYHIRTETGEATWDVPATPNRDDGDGSAARPHHIPLSSPSMESHRRVAEDVRQYAKKRARESQERLAVVRQSHEAWKLDQAKAKSKADESERRRQDAIWRELCERSAAASTTSGNGNATIRVAWQNFGYISSRIYSFEQDYGGCRLAKLCLEGNNLQSIGDIAAHCINLTHLSLASNNMRTLEAGDISRLSKLEHLNLLGNQLRALPDDVGNLTNLHEMEIAGNRLTHLPGGICKLQHLRRLNVECNDLVELPEGIGDMVACQEINANSNSLVELPRSICRLATLRKLFVNDNKLQRLPNEIGNLGNLQTLHASKNNITTLPSSICQLHSMQSLWLDYNRQMAALPADFHHLRELRDLKMDGNPNMVLPPIEKLAEGARAVLRWNECRYASNQHSLQQSIIMSVQDVLRQVSRTRGLFDDDDCRPLISVFEENVDRKGQLYYQFLPEALWAVFLPKLEDIWSNKDQHVVGIRSFPYCRNDVERALTEFRDAGGKVAHHYAKSKFRRCSCGNNSSKKKTCFRTSQDTWMCQRPALLLRMNIIRERDMAERKQKNIEHARIDAAVESAQRSAKRHLSSDEGKRRVHKQAEERVVAEGLAAALARNVGKDGECNEESDDVSTNASENTTLTMASTVRRELARKATTMKIKLHPSFSKEVQVMEDVLRKEYVNTEIDKRRKAAEETNRKMKAILSSWLGMSTEEAFFGWKEGIQEAKRGRKRDAKAQMRADRLKYESNLALLEYAKRQIGLWQEKWDEFNDVKFWEKEKTGESTYDEPTVDQFLPSGWVMSEPPNHIFDEETGELLDRAAIDEIELESAPDFYESEYNSLSLDDQSTSIAAPTLGRECRVTFAFPENVDNGCEGGTLLVEDKVGVDAEATIAAERILKRKRDILLQTRKTQRKSSTSIQNAG